MIMCHNPGQTRFVKKESSHTGARVGKSDQIVETSVKIVWALRMCINRAPSIKKALDPDLVFIRGTTHPFEFVVRRYFEHFGRTNSLVRYAGWSSFSVRKVIVLILK